MSRLTRMIAPWLVLAAVFALLAPAIVRMPAFGSSYHPYRDLAIPAAVKHATANTVSAVNFDQRALDTLAEETILFGSVVGVVVLLRRKTEESERQPRDRGQVLNAAKMLVAASLPVSLIIGVDVVAPGAATPGRGFQGGVIIATGLHLLYVGARYEALKRIRPVQLFEWGESLSITAFIGLGQAGLAAGGAFLANFIGQGAFGSLFFTGTVPLLNGAVGLAVASRIIVLLAQFLEQAIEIGEQQQ